MTHTMRSQESILISLPTCESTTQIAHVLHICSSVGTYVVYCRTQSKTLRYKYYIITNHHTKSAKTKQKPRVKLKQNKSRQNMIRYNIFAKLFTSFPSSVHDDDNPSPSHCGKPCSSFQRCFLFLHCLFHYYSKRQWNYKTDMVRGWEEMVAREEVAVVGEGEKMQFASHILSQTQMTSQTSRICPLYLSCFSFGVDDPLCPPCFPSGVDDDRCSSAHGACRRRRSSSCACAYFACCWFLRGVSSRNHLQCRSLHQVHG